MKLIMPDRNPGAYAVRVQCLRCGTMRLLADMSADLDGLSFRAYYCAGADAFNGKVPDCRPLDKEC